MRNYNDFMEALSMKDMKDLGGTDAQKKIAQDRQRRREAKNRGMGNPNEEPTSTAAAADAEKKEKAGAIVKKPDLRKSQIGKWSEGIKKAPKSSALAKVEKTREENKAEAKQKLASGSAGEPKLTEKPKPNKPVGKGLEKSMRKKRKEARKDVEAARRAEKHQWDREDREEKKREKEEKRKRELNKKRGDAIKNVASAPFRLVKNAAKKASNALDTSQQGTSSSGDLEGVTGKQTYE